MSTQTTKPPDEDEGGVLIPPEVGILPLRDTVLFPFMITPLLVGREKSIILINESLATDKIVGLITQQKTEVEDPRPEDLYQYGTVCKIHKMIRYPDQRVNIIVQGLQRFRVERFVQEAPYFKAAIVTLSDLIQEDMETQALCRSVSTQFQKILSLSPLPVKELQMSVHNILEPGRLADFIVSNMDVEVAKKELGRFATINPAAAEYTVSKTYLEWLVSLPWSVSTRDTIDIRRARSILNRDHYDLTKVKERILEYLAVRKLKKDTKGPILCFVGPPGVGKTSLGRSIAAAMGRKFIRISLGGVRDEAEIRGHRRTYVGALPGRVIQNIKKCGARNPVFMIDEVDKIGIDFRGDPASALLEVLDPEQNFSFSDHYLEVPFDLSAVMFITTANILDPIPPALHDRMEVLDLPGYTEEEKIQIARGYLIPRQIKEHGLTTHHVRFSKDALEGIIRDYTREAGLRNLEREIATVCRKVAKAVAQGNMRKVSVTRENLRKYLGPIRYFSEIAERTGEPGVAVGLAWTPAGGEILFIEAKRMKGKKGLTLTGQLGDVMKESAVAAMSFIRSHSRALGIAEDFFDRSDIHIHVPAGAIPKDGPSAGVAITAALISLLRGTPLDSSVAMTGEITLTGKILPVGGVKEKILAARRAGIKKVIIPEKNKKDLLEIPAVLRRSMKFIFVKDLSHLFSYFFLNRKTRKKN